MDDAINHLKAKIKSLIQAYEQLKKENNHLYQNQFLLTREKEILQAKHKVAISQIETMVFRLKSLEKSQ
jgi:uncharacterized protein (TIGR02449 family)